jgi:tyrosine-protein phosphatase SIW14
MLWRSNTATSQMASHLCRCKNCSPRIGTLSLISALLLIFPANAERLTDCARSSSQPEPARRLKIEGIPNVAEVNPHLYRGGAPTDRGLRTLSKMGIGVVIDLRGLSQGEKREATKLGMQYIPLPRHCPFPKDAVFARILTVLRDNPGKKVFVHCRLGDDRAGMMIAAYRMGEQGWTAQQAIKEMELYGFSSSHRFICPSLASYETHFPKRFKTSPAFRALRDQRQSPSATH